MTTNSESAPVYATQRWYLLLKDAVARHGVNKVAQMLGYSNHTGTSQVLAGKYAGKTDAFAARVVKVFDVVRCLHNGQSMPMGQCRETATARPPLHNPMKMQQWRACQQCKNKPEV